MSQELGVRTEFLGRQLFSVIMAVHISFDQGWCTLQVVMYSRSAFAPWCNRIWKRYDFLKMTSTSKSLTTNLCHHEYRPNTVDDNLPNLEEIQPFLSSIRAVLGEFCLLFFYTLVSWSFAHDGTAWCAVSTAAPEKSLAARQLFMWLQTLTKRHF